MLLLLLLLSGKELLHVPVTGLRFIIGLCRI